MKTRNPAFNMFDFFNYKFINTNTTHTKKTQNQCKYVIAYIMLEPYGANNDQQ